MRKKFLILLCIFIITSAIGCQTSAKKPVVPEQKPDQVNNNELTASERRILADKLADIAEDVDRVEKATVIVTSIGMTNNLQKNTGNGLTNNRSNNNLNKNDNQNNQNNIRDDFNNNLNNNNISNLNNNNRIDYSGLLIMVGLNLTNETKNNINNANSIKKTVANKLKASDNRISQVLVTSDPNLVERINDVAAGMIRGEPVRNFEDDVKDLNKRLRQQQPAF